MNLKHLYKFFLRETITKKYLDKYKNPMVLGESFINKHYIVIFETDKKKGA